MVERAVGGECEDRVVLFAATPLYVNQSPINPFLRSLHRRHFPGIGPMSALFIPRPRLFPFFRPLAVPMLLTPACFRFFHLLSMLWPGLFMLRLFLEWGIGDILDILNVKML